MIARILADPRTSGAVLILIHLVALAGILAGATSWAAVGTMFVLLYLTGGLGICVGYHRLLTHRGFTTPKPIEYTLAMLGQLTWQGDPIEWVSTHRKHHAHSDHEEDPHSPIHGFSWSHIIWLLVPNARRPVGPEVARLVPDLLSDPFYRYTRIAWLPLQLALAVALYALEGWPGVIWGVFVRLVVTYHFTWSVNSLSHTFGSRPYETTDRSTNNWLVALLSWGEGWHNNHHAFPASPRHGLARFQLDPSWWVIKGLALVGLAKDLRLPSAAALARRLRGPERNAA